METKRLIVPCKDCVDRGINCHSSCEKYKTFKELNNERNLKIRNSKHMDYTTTDFDSKAKNRWGKMK